ncbi:hypothetical protein [Chitinophaga rhizophila]|uniref:Dolichyl-phosphate-mannose-protein mannosyltransferase n=1 Tax=Chitinophaga rhizophila TaxID=2866212 RepID=A0ABS7GKB3_9BACT|nr:hypothetical protein [Chitinophaga rhizophila]MBW8688167.1 hypothetical protein [Chitinophaga rhizophila]
MSNPSLKDYIFKDPNNRPYVWTAIIGILIQLIFFKYLYPYASFINGDSYAYMETAHQNLSINTYPVGYSMFIRLFSVFTHSDTALVVFQYLMLQASILSLVFTLFYFYNPHRYTRIGLFGFMLFNPVFLYLANYVSSDTLFLSLSLTWFNILLWIIYRPSRKLMIYHAIVLFLAFTVRYNALYYPLIAGIAFLLSRQPILQKVLGLVICVILIGSFIQYNKHKYYEISKKSIFTPFTGWQMANNAMYAYKFVPKAERKPVPKKYQVLDSMIREYFDSTVGNPRHPEEDLVASTIYMWTPGAPLRTYMQNQFKKDTLAPELKRWATVAPLYEEYGKYIIKQYPIPFAKFYLLPNALKYYAPPIEFLEYYSTNQETVHPIAQTWFEYKSDKVETKFKDFKVDILNYYPILVGTMNVIFFLGMLGFLLLQGYKQHSLLGKGLLLVVCLWLTNFGFSVFASPIALRFQMFPILIMTSFAFLFMEYLIREATKKE